MWTIFEYCYRDAANYKSFGKLWLEGRMTPAERRVIESRLADGEYFIAEQIGIPPLYEQLYSLSDGHTSDDHCWHELFDIRHAGILPADAKPWGSVDDLVRRFGVAEEWDQRHTPHTVEIVIERVN
ncbi:MAG: hypothetical protein J7499_10785 [Sphingopyxis sp.]|nr:hypothetical protein [Sphingopyxis sp.]